MADWFDKTNSEDAFAKTAYTRTVLHGQAAKGNPLAEKSFIIAVSGVRHEDGADFLKDKATDAVWDDISNAFDRLYRDLADPHDNMWLINFIKKADEGDNDTNSQIPQVHIHVLSGPLKPGKEFITEDRSFHPHPKKDIYDLFAENKLDVLGVNMGEGIKAVPLPPGVKEAETHYAVVDEKYASFADFIEKATVEEKRAFWKTIARLALPLIEEGHGARVGYYDLKGDVDRRVGHMMVEVAGGENLGQNGSRNRWLQKPGPKAP